MVWPDLSQHHFPLLWLRLHRIGDYLGKLEDLVLWSRNRHVSHVQLHSDDHTHRLHGGRRLW